MIDDDNGDLNKYYFKLGQHYAGLKEYKVRLESFDVFFHNCVQMAEKFYLSGNLYKHAIEMYNTAGLWEQVKLFYCLLDLHFLIRHINWQASTLTQLK